MNLLDIKKELIGEFASFETPYGERVMTYADYTASGRGLHFIEKYLLQVQAFYANSHTEDSVTGASMTALVHGSEQLIKAHFNAREDYIIPVGTGATGAIAKLSEILGFYVAPKMRERLENSLQNGHPHQTIEELLGDTRPVVFIGPYEHHSNDLAWRESIVEVVEIRLNEAGEICLIDLEEKLSQQKYTNRVKLGSFSAGSNVTGLKSPVYDLARLLHRYDAYAAFDFAGSGPYMTIDMNVDEEAYFDAVYLSPHKFIGGPGSAGLLLINKALYSEDMAPTVAGGGTVDYVSSFDYEFTSDVEAREMAGTPGVIQILRAALAIDLKQKIGVELIEAQEHAFMTRVFDRLKSNSGVEIFGSLDATKRVSIMSFNIKSGGDYLHHRLVSMLLNDLFGIQSRAGCSCAGPYGHKLLGIDEATSRRYRDAIKSGVGALKPGWVRVNFHFTMTPEEVDFIVDAIEFVADYGYLFLDAYAMSVGTGLWTHREKPMQLQFVEGFGIEAAFDGRRCVDEVIVIDKGPLYRLYLQEARGHAQELAKHFTPEYEAFESEELNQLKWFQFKHVKS